MEEQERENKGTNGGNQQTDDGIDQVARVAFLGKADKVEYGRSDTQHAVLELHGTHKDTGQTRCSHNTVQNGFVRHGNAIQCRLSNAQTCRERTRQRNVFQIRIFGLQTNSEGSAAFGTVVSQSGQSV